MSVWPPANGSGKLLGVLLAMVVGLGSWALRGAVESGVTGENLRTRVNRNEADIQAIQSDVRRTSDDTQYLRARWETLEPALQEAIRRAP